VGISTQIAQSSLTCPLLTKLTILTQLTKLGNDIQSALNNLHASTREGSNMTFRKAPRRAIILSALGVETRSVLRQLPDVHEVHVRDTVFHVGSLEDWQIAIAEVGVGNVRAALIVGRAIEHFDPEVALFVGVARGIKDVEIGDVVVAIKIYGYESGKEGPQGFQSRPENLCYCACH
jgi:hypothetical protein